MQKTQWKVLVMLIVGGIITYVLIKGLTIQPVTSTTTPPASSTPTAPTYEPSGYETNGY